MTEMIRITKRRYMMQKKLNAKIEITLNYEKPRIENI